MSGFISPYTSTVEGARVKFACHLSPDPEEGLKTTICNQNGAWEPNPIDICETSQRELKIILLMTLYTKII